MPEKKEPLLSDEFLDQLTREINEQFGGPAFEQNDGSEEMEPE
ncbi:bacitracin ABC transporter ATP-binding protein [Fictibacillus fluitans]|uniref:Bacitracin ABC transporter ATP-binding protein n=1 Tax=Fictibacillus fluitans TaxID=3058422 RepID=A0ABT8HXE9_9BACL|nr:bacitracin ABC transporter ATP-binding protein [Fictibacillus sp. NE201]MDN4525155.1 bacitracin ABC transporter ATP-binding protein [Fictibacillus sp. NE201]